MFYFKKKFVHFAQTTLILLLNTNHTKQNTAITKIIGAILQQFAL